MTLQQMAVTVMMCNDERRDQFLRRLADACFCGSTTDAEAYTMRLAACVVW